MPEASTLPAPTEPALPAELVTPLYRELWNDPSIQDRIEQGIRTHRQSDGTIRITSFDGQPLAGVRVYVRQHDSPFHFGANIFKLGDYPSEEQNRRYEDAFCGLFNGATVPFYWRTLEPEQGRPRYSAHSVPITRRPPPDRVVEFCQRRGLRMHGHTLVWNHLRWSIPDWLPLDAEKSDPIYENRLREIGERYGQSIQRWDVLNEAVAARTWPWSVHPMSDDYEEKAFAWAEKHLPADARLDINETSDAWQDHAARYVALIDRLRRAGARVGAIGLQFHLFTDDDLRKALRGEIHRPDRLFEALDTYGQFGLPIHVSEITLTSPDLSKEGLDAQAEVARNFYRLWFSHPAVDGISWWNVPDGGAAQGEGAYSGLLHADMSPKPSYHMLKDLLHREWRTETSGVTDADGIFRFRGYHGTYVVRTDTGAADSGLEFSLTLTPSQPSHLHVRL